MRYAITDRRIGLAAGSRAEEHLQQRLIARCAALAAEGVDYLLIREKDLSAGPFAGLSRNILEAVRATSTKVLIASRLDVALATGADGVHLSANPGELTPAQVRQLMPKASISISCHTLDEVTRARGLDASVILFGPIFGKTVNGEEVTPAIGLDLLHQACALAGEMPVFALGGITAGNAPLCEAAGAQGIAAIRLFFAASQ